MGREPLISVIMSVYNEEQYIEESLKSILTQTQQDFEIIIFDDCSIDNTVSIIENFRDDRIYLYQNVQNMGLTKNLNQGLRLAKGRFIARMDGDDISFPERFEAQLQYFREHPDVLLISCQTQTFGAENLTWKLKDDPDRLKIMMLVRPVLAHPGFMMRRELLKLGYLYDESFRSAQDYDLAARVTRKYPIGIASPVLLKYRAHDAQISIKSESQQLGNADRVREFLLKEISITLREEEKKQYHMLVQETKTKEISDFLNVRDILEKIIAANRKVEVYDETLLKDTLYEQLFTWMLRNKSVKICLLLLWHCKENWKCCFSVFINILLQKL